MPQLGNERRFYVGTGKTWLAGEQSNSFNRTSNPIEVTDKSVKWQQFIAGVRGATATVTVFTDDTDGGPQHDCLEGWSEGDVVKCFVGVLDENTVVSGDAFDAIITSISDTNNSNEVASREIQLNATGVVTHTAKSS